MKVLVIDDKWLVRAVSRAMLESAGYEVLEAADGAEGLAVLGQRGADVILCDLLMPEKDGLGVLRQLRGQASTPVVVMSGRADHLDSSQFFPAAVLLGAAATLHKPFTREELL